MTRGRKAAGTEVSIGAHCMGGIAGAVDKALTIGAGPIQIFIGSPQSWKEPSTGAKDLAQFARRVESHRLGPVFVHSSYLVNLGSATDRIRAMSARSLGLQLRLADAAMAAGLIFHPGSAGQTPYDIALARVIKALEGILDGYTGSCRVLLEVCAGTGQTLGANFRQIRDMLSGVGFDRRVAVCWDTCHLFNAGYDVGSKDGLARTVDEFASQIGFEWLAAIHANDSKTPLGARRDRHENIGLGHIGEVAFRRMLHHPALRALPWLLEVPGLDGKGPDRVNIETMRRLAR